jgi:2',3'-cyclic-nucleotide 2'-phosphodiesterase (5'-nucleotidase family)
VQAPVDSTVLAIITPYQNGIESQMNEVLCVSEMEMNKGKPESLLGNFVTDLCLNYADAHVCVMNTGGLRSSLPKGNITRGDIYTLMPFENELVVLELDIESFKGLVDYITKRGGEPFSGMTLKASSKGYDIEEVSRMEDYFDFNKGNKIRVLTSDYLANGGDKMWFFKDKEQNKVGIKLRDAIIDHCSKSDTISSKLDNRLIFTENE